MKLRISARLGLVFAITTSCFGAPVLTGLINFSTTAAGAASGGEFWNTRGEDIFYNLYVTAPNSGLAGPFLNSGNSAGTAVNIDLGTPGNYTFYILGEQGGSATRYGLNLFFDGSTTPGITAVRGVNAAGSVSSTAANTVTIGGGSTPGANTLQYTDGGITVTLTDYGWYNSASTALPSTDRVSRYSTSPSTFPDYRGSFVLSVGLAVPEPGTWALLLVGLVGLGFAKNRF